MTTFWSFKGGVGRSVAAANFSVYLARLGLKTVVIDCDLDAPSLDGKLQVNVPIGHPGLLNYILDSQGGTSPSKVGDLLLPIPLKGATVSPGVTLQLLPVGYWPSSDYHLNLAKLDWNEMIRNTEKSQEMFGRLLVDIRDQIGAEYLVVNSRTGFSEGRNSFAFALSDELVIFSSFSAENVSAISELARNIRSGVRPRMGGSAIAIKTVFSMVPHDKDLSSFRDDVAHLVPAADQQDFDPRNVFILPSIRETNPHDLLVFNELTGTGEIERLVAAYVRLFTELDPGLTKVIIPQKLSEFTARLWGLPTEKADSLANELSVRIPHPSVFRWAMNWFRHRGDLRRVCEFASRLLTMEPEDPDALAELARVYQADKKVFQGEDSVSLGWKRKAITVFERLERTGTLSEGLRLELANLLKDDGEHQEALTIASSLMSNERVGEVIGDAARSIALYCAVQVKDDARIKEILKPLDSQGIQRITPETAFFLLPWCAEHSGHQSVGIELALALAHKGMLSPAQDLVSLGVLRKVLSLSARLASTTNRAQQLEEAIAESASKLAARGDLSIEQVQHLARWCSEAGLTAVSGRLKRLID